MTGRRIVLADGTTYEDSNCGFADGFLWCFIKNHSVADVAQVFFNPAATQEIRHKYGTNVDTYTGFTVVFAMQTQDDGCAVCVTKPTSEVQA